jgi:hypothetical protein
MTEIATLAPTNDLAIPTTTALATGLTAETFDEFVSSYLPRLQLFDSNSGAVKRKQIGMGNYGLVINTSVTDLGDEVKCFVLSARLKAMCLNDGVRSYFDPKHSEFLKIKALADTPNTGCLCGPEFLLYLPTQKKFVTFFMSSKTMRRESPNLMALLSKSALLKTRFIENGKFSWYGPVVVAYSTPLDPPPAERMGVEIDKFRNPPVEETEVVEEDKRAR